MAKDKLELVQLQLDAFARGDWDTYKAGLADDAKYEEEATQRTVNGPDEILDLVKKWKEAFPDVKGTIKSSFQSGDSVVIELEWTGTHTGPLTGQFGTIPATGKFGKVPAVEVIRFDGDKVIETRHYFDLMTLLQQIGVAPQAQPSAAG